MGLVDGSDIAGILVAETTNSVTHAVLAVLGLFCGLTLLESQRPSEDPGARAALQPRPDERSADSDRHALS